MKKAIEAYLGRWVRERGRRNSGQGRAPTIGSLRKGARFMYLAGGWFFAGLALLGVLLPLLPTTPFLLLAGTCFARSSPRLHDRVLNLPVFGDYLRQWDESHTVPKRAKHRAWALITVSFGLSTYLVESTGLRLMLVVLGFGLGCIVALLPEKEAFCLPSQDPNSASVGTGADDRPSSFPTEASDGIHSEEEPTTDDQSAPKRLRLPSR